MPAKLRKSRSRNVTKGNNRPASKQSRKRKTPKNNVSKGKARKTTRRRSKRGGMFGIRKSKGPSEKEQLDWFMKEVLIHFLRNLKENETPEYIKQKHLTVEQIRNTDSIEGMFAAEFNFTHIRGTSGVPTRSRITGEVQFQTDGEARHRLCNEKYDYLKRSVFNIFNHYKKTENETTESKILIPALMNGDANFDVDKLKNLYEKHYKWPMFPMKKVKDPLNRGTDVTIPKACEL